MLNSITAHCPSLTHPLNETFTEFEGFESHRAGLQALPCHCGFVTLGKIARHSQCHSESVKCVLQEYYEEKINMDRGNIYNL